MRLRLGKETNRHSLFENTQVNFNLINGDAVIPSKSDKGAH